MSEASQGAGWECGPPTPDQQRLIEFGETLFRRVVPDAVLGHLLLPEDDAVAVVHRVRGGGKVYVAPDRSVLFYGSARDVEFGLTEFRAGRRTPVEKFG